ncbi:MAG: hypothetical protein EP329_17660 [Deltaproteobacteria bacterium]|nr:MAG: hypothetical protein EP329_17660 [Deltaproteobacteria bacterium]
MSRIPLLVGIVATLLGPLLVERAATARDVDVVIDLGGGTLLAWNAPEQVGNAFGLAAFVGLGAFEVGVSGALVLPDSRVQGDFGAYWVEGRWFPLERTGLWSPWLALGLGVATDDGLDARTIDAIRPIRWVTEGPSALAVAAIGLRYGRRSGLHFSVDLRAYNHSHGGMNLIVGYAF